eukprot:CAMPEP_0168528384 /NCGR_PEP_ID=MMETSP0405-20121227/13217_1 /TAXON_ID=498012 /ORGANISM="Trichosphaerium sp, Strain Am-I-7 wt" /LENGTH=121 /DNA_ID=CAMNT_0008551779 /DNA_START=848 /DNA_END=1210 /DNA_ORIENTATION=+
MVDAMGVTGYEGVFRKSSELTMEILRRNKDTLLSVLETFIHDPLVEWGVSSRRYKQRLDKWGKARQIMDGIKDRLEGKDRRMDHTAVLIPLQVEGHVHSLISDATDINNLCQMYVGWQAWL